MAKEIVKKIKLQVPAGKATPAPPVGTVLGPAGVNLQDFCSQFNEASREKMGDIVPVEISVYDDRSFTFVIKTPPASFLLKKAAKGVKGSSKGANQVVATISQEDLRKIAELKLVDLNAYDVESAMNIIEGTARNMGIAIKGINDEELKLQGVEAAALEVKMEQREHELAELEEQAKETSDKEVEVITEKDNDEEEDSDSDNKKNKDKE